MVNEAHLLIEQSQGLVRSLALKVFGSLPRSASLDDLIGYGQVGLTQAANAYDASSGVAFSTYAYYRIRGAIYDGLAQMTGCPRHIRRKIRFEQRATEHLSEQAAGGGNQGDVAAECRWLLETTRELATVFLANIAADAAPDQGLPPDAALERREIVALLRKFVEELPEPDRSVIRLAYFEELNLTEIAQRYQKDKSWACRAHSRIVSQLARQLAAAGAA